MPAAGRVWQLVVRREGIQKSGAAKRTYGSYQVLIDGSDVGLSGHMCERDGPGDNSRARNGKRIEAGTYPLWTQFGKYRTIGYSTDIHTPGARPMPGIGVEATGRRTGILIHPGHPPTLYLSSIGCFNPTAPLTADQTMEYFDSRNRVVGLIESLRSFAPSAFAHQVMTRIAGASLKVVGEPENVLTDAPNVAIALAAETIVEPDSLPISKSASMDCARWLASNFGPALRRATTGKAYKIEHLCGIVCQETAYKWLKWTETKTPKEIVERCVFDASGDYPGAPRSAFPRNTAEFRAKYGAAFTDMLINEANLTRRLQGWGDKQWIYKGYGIFQYDLQHVRTDPDFFTQKQWCDFAKCLDRVGKELDARLVDSGGDLWDAIRRYNGSGAAAQRYAANVKTFTRYCKEALSA